METKLKAEASAVRGQGKGATGLTSGTSMPNEKGRGEKKSLSPFLQFSANRCVRGKRQHPSGGNIAVL